MADADSSTHKNPYLDHIHRAPYELGYLLKRLSPDFAWHSKPVGDDLLIAKAAVRHASNANETVLSGIEAIGKMMFAVANSEYSVEQQHVAHLGELISHLAVESQFLQEITGSLTEALHNHDADNTKRECRHLCASMPSDNGSQIPDL